MSDTARGLRLREIGASAIPPTPNIAITYCRLCNWLLRAAWMGQELLSTFAEELGSVTLIPDDTGGVFEVRLDGKLMWSRKDHGRFPEIKELKQLVGTRWRPSAILDMSTRKTPNPQRSRPGAGRLSSCIRLFSASGSRDGGYTT